MDAMLTLATLGIFIALVLLMERRTSRRAKERSAPLVAEIERLREKRERLLEKAATPPSWISPDWAKTARLSLKETALRTLVRAKRSLNIARSSAASRPDAARILIAGTSADLAAAERTIFVADEIIPGIVAHQRLFARDMLAKVSAFRGELESVIRRHVAEGLPIQDAASRIDLMRNALEADANVIDHDPQGALDLMRRQLVYMEGIGGIVAHFASLRDHIIELGRTLPSRVDDAETAFAAARRMLSDLKAKRPDEDWSGAEDVLSTLPGLMESVRNKIRVAEIICKTDPSRLSDALAEAVRAESAMATIDGRLLSITETWSENVPRPFTGN